jgi:hypothetical protein
MYLVLDEIRDLLEAQTTVSNIAESGTTATNIKVTSHGLILGDRVVNATRGNAERVVTAVVDANNFTVDSVTSQTSGDTIKFPKFKKYYVGKLPEKTVVPVNHLPILMVYGEETTLQDRITTGKDIYKRSIGIDILTSAFVHVSEAEDNGDLQAQKQLWHLMEELDTNAIPKAYSILGVLRRNIRMTYSLFNNDISINYDQFQPGNVLYYRGRAKFSVTMHNLRS